MANHGGKRYDILFDLRPTVRWPRFDLFFDFGLYFLLLLLLLHHLHLRPKHSSLHLKDFLRIHFTSLAKIND